MKNGDRRQTPKKSIVFLSACGVALGLAFGLSGCLEVNNSSSSDSTVYGAIDSSRPHITIMQQKCAPCHSLGGFDHEALGRLSDAEFISRGYVVAGDAANSDLYRKITGTLGSLMPPATSPFGALTDGEKTVIQNWINGL